MARSRTDLEGADTRISVDRRRTTGACFLYWKYITAHTRLMLISFSFMILLSSGQVTCVSVVRVCCVCVCDVLCC